MRLIDADALEKTIHADYGPLRDDGESDYQSGIAVALISVKEAVTIDAAPVVRCRDCRHSSKIANSTKGERHCWSLRGKNNGDGLSRVNGDGYCDEGARMDADAPERGERSGT